MAAFFRKPNVDKMLRGLTAKQFMGWEAFVALEPWVFDPELRQDYRIAAICMMLHNTNVKKEDIIKELKAFVLPFEEPDKPEKKPATPEQTQRQQLEMLKLLAAMQEAAQGAAPGVITFAK